MLHSIPWILFLWTLLGFCVTYVWSYLNGHWNGHLPPFLSGTIDFEPEACVGGLVLSVGAGLFGIIVWIRWAKLEEPQPKGETVLFVLGILAAVSLAAVGSFRHHNIPIAHLAFALCFFVFANVYLTGSLFLRRSDRFTSVRLRRVQVALSLLALLCFCVYFTFLLVARFGSTGQMPAANVSATFEILMVLVFLFHSLSYSSELKGYSVMVSKRRRHQEEEEEEEDTDGGGLAMDDTF